MNFDYTDDQKFLKDEARKFLAARCTSATTRAVLDDDARPFDPELWREVAAMGWTGAAIPEEYGGTGMGHVELCAIAEELGRVVAPIPFASTVYGFAEGLMKAGSEAQKAALLPGVAGGAVIGCLATSDGPGPIDAETTTATVAGGRPVGRQDTGDRWRYSHPRHRSWRAATRGRACTWSTSPPTASPAQP